VQIRQWFKSTGYGVSARASMHFVGHYIILFQNARSLQHKVWKNNIKVNLKGTVCGGVE
jgi:hypothetical protein